MYPVNRAYFLFLYSSCRGISLTLFYNGFLLFYSRCFTASYIFSFFCFLFYCRPNPLDSTNCWNLECVEWNHESETFLKIFKEPFSITLNACKYPNTIYCQGHGESIFSKGAASPANRVVFKWLSKNQYQSIYSDQSQQEQTARWTNQIPSNYL